VRNRRTHFVGNMIPRVSNFPLSVLTSQDLVLFEERGFVIARQVVPPESLADVIDAIWTFLEMDSTDANDWYREPLSPTGMVELYQHQALWNNRQNPRVYQTFAHLLGTERLWVSIDRVSLKPPINKKFPDYQHQKEIHWDVDTSSPPSSLEVQGVLCLNDTDEEMGGFQCIPGFHRHLKEWIRHQPADRDPFIPDLAALPVQMPVTKVPANAGDLIIWNSLLPHGNGYNVSSRPRLAQYVSMRPHSDNEADRCDRIARWLNREPPKEKWVKADPRQLEQRIGRTAVLTSLGRALLGLDLWPMK